MTLELARGSLDGQAQARASRLDLAQDKARPDEGVYVVDLPDIADAHHWGPPGRLVIFDDRDAFAGHAAIVVQPSLPHWSGPGTADRILAGYDYAPVALGFRELRERNDDDRPVSPDDQPLRVLVCFGGSDPHGVTERLASGFSGGSSWAATTIVGSRHPPLEPQSIELVRDPADLGERLAGCDLAVLGGGTMKFEAACLGRPAVLVAVADDQLAVGPPFAATGAAIWLGDGRTLEPRLLRKTLDELADSSERRRAIGARARQVVDGLGAERLADAIIRLAQANP